MVEMELVTKEVQLMRSCLVFRAMEITDARQDVYTRLVNNLYGAGLFCWSALEAACIVLSLAEFARYAKEIGHTVLGADALELAALIHWQAYALELGEIPKESSPQLEMAVLAHVS